MKDDVKGRRRLAGNEPGPVVTDFKRSWMGWTKDDPAWRWFNAVAEADAFARPEAFIEEIAKHAPPQAMPFVADFLRRRLKLDKRQPKHPRWLWQPKSVLAIAGRYVYALKQKGFRLGEAVDEVLRIFPAFKNFFDRQTLYDHCNQDTKLGRYEMKRMKLITKAPPD